MVARRDLRHVERDGQRDERVDHRDGRRRDDRAPRDLAVGTRVPEALVVLGAERRVEACEQAGRVVSETEQRRDEQRDQRADVDDEQPRQGCAQAQPETHARVSGQRPRDASAGTRGRCRAGGGRGGGRRRRHSGRPTRGVGRRPPPVGSGSRGDQLALISSQAFSQSLYGTHFTPVRPSRHLAVGVAQYESRS